MIRPVILWTDALVFLLLAVIAAYIWYVRRHEHLAVPWRKVAQSASGMSALVVLLCFVLIGFLDTLHYRAAIGAPAGKDAKPTYAVEVLSALDAIVGPLRTQKEKTYSAPLATHLFAKETMQRADGRETREFPRLRYGGAHLEDPQRDHAGDVVQVALAGLGLALLVWLVAVALVCTWVARRSRNGLRDAWRAVLCRETSVPWFAILLTMGAVCVVAGPVATLAAKYHVFGTDKVGQDVLYLALKSIRPGLIIGTLSTLVMLPFALALGIMAGYFRKLVDDVIQYLYTTLHSIPGVLLIAAAVLMMQVFVENHTSLFPTTVERADFRLLFLCLILGVTSWTSLCRLLRGESLKLREMEYIQAAHAFGVSHARIMMRHILPNVMHIVLIAVVMDFSGLVLAEAVLSYIGIGVDPSMNSFGSMINSARLEMAREPMVWWSLAAAFSFMLMLVLAANLFGDAVRDALDPRVTGRKAVPVKPAKVAA
ncbi:MAG: ABC transporter permease [Burkholderiales bacterium]